jgi:hypothetical protein
MAAALDRAGWNIRQRLEISEDPELLADFTSLRDLARLNGDGWTKPVFGYLAEPVRKMVKAGGRLSGEKYAEIAEELEQAVRTLERNEGPTGADELRWLCDALDAAALRQSGPDRTDAADALRRYRKALAKAWVIRQAIRFGEKVEFSSTNLAAAEALTRRSRHDSIEGSTAPSQG